jgi:hypothetical protein
MAIDAPAIVVNPSNAAMSPIWEHKRHVEHDFNPPCRDIAKTVRNLV